MSDESTLRARNIPDNDAYDLTKAIERADQARKQKSVADYWSVPPSEQGTLREHAVAPQPKRENPCIDTYGADPGRHCCNECAYLAGIAHARIYYKCKLRKNTHSKATDHGRYWQACAKFEPRAEGKDIPLYDGR